MKSNHVNALKKAIDITGGQGALANRMREFGKKTVTQQTVSYWLRNKVLLNAEWWPAIEFATDNKVTRADLRPDVFTDCSVN